jgi:secondary thiamine-phosphate synthase enzyme
MPTIEIVSQKRVEMIDVTDAVRHALTESGHQSGLVHLFTPHTTAAITINENADPDVVRDLITTLNQLIPLDGDYRHLEGNSAAHLKSSLIGCSETVPFASGRLQLGTWQGIYFCEFDGPRRRQLQIKVLQG